MSKRRKFSAEFKRGAVEQASQPGVSCAQVARELGIRDTLLTRAGSGSESPSQGTVEFGGAGTPARLAAAKAAWQAQPAGADAARRAQPAGRRLHRTGAGDQVGHRHHRAQDPTGQAVPVHRAGPVRPVGRGLVDASPTGSADGDSSSGDGGLAAPGNAPIILHSDRGSQFRSGDYQRYLRANGLVCSMSAVGHCGDNAACEASSACSGAVHNPRMRRRVARQDQKFSTLLQPSVISG